MAPSVAGLATAGAGVVGGTAGTDSASAVGLLVVVGAGAAAIGTAPGGVTGGGGSGGGSGALLMPGTGWDNCSRTEVELVQGRRDLPSSLLCC